MMLRAHKRRPESMLRPIREQIATFFDEADALFKQDKKELAKRKVKSARRIAMKVQLRIPQYKDRYCRDCNSYLQLGTNASIRIRDKIRIRTCKECGAVRRRKLK